MDAAFPLHYSNVVKLLIIPLDSLSTTIVIHSIEIAQQCYVTLFGEGLLWYVSAHFAPRHTSICTIQKFVEEFNELELLSVI